MKLNFQNEYGQLALSLVSEIKHVDTIYSKAIALEHKFDIRTMEKIALITENHGVQLASYLDGKEWLCYVVVHETTHTAAVAKIDSINYIGGIPSKEIQKELRSQHVPL